MFLFSLSRTICWEEPVFVCLKVIRWTKLMHNSILCLTSLQIIFLPFLVWVCVFDFVSSVEFWNELCLRRGCICKQRDKEGYEALDQKCVMEITLNMGGNMQMEKLENNTMFANILAPFIFVLGFLFGLGLFFSCVHVAVKVLSSTMWNLLSEHRVSVQCGSYPADTVNTSPPNKAFGFGNFTCNYVVQH